MILDGLIYELENENDIIPNVKELAIKGSKNFIGDH